MESAFSTFLLIGLCASVLVADAHTDADSVVPESQDVATSNHVLLHRRPRSDAQHKRLTDWITKTHTRQEHPEVLIMESSTIGTGKLVTETELKNADLVEYYGNVGIGDQKFQVVFDTGSGIFWVPGEKCHAEACKMHEQLKMSKKIKVEHGDVDIRYGTGHMTGQRAVSDVHVGGVKVKNQDFLMSTQEHGDVFSMGKFDGVFGMGRKALASILQKPGDSQDRAAPFYINAIHQNLLRKPEFSFYVSARDHKPGAVILGGTNHALYKGPVTMHQGHSDAYWMMDIEALRVGDKDKSADDAFLSIDTRDPDGLGFRSLRGIADSGTSLLVGPPKFVTPILEHVTVHDDCSNMAALKTVHIAMRSVEGKQVHYSLTPEQYVMKRGGSCKTGIATMDLKLPGTHPIMILGDTFLRAHYSVYDHENNRVGFAVANHDHEAFGNHVPKLVENDVEADY
jgi:hypothetical protein